MKNSCKEEPHRNWNKIFALFLFLVFWCLFFFGFWFGFFWCCNCRLFTAEHRLWARHCSFFAADRNFCKNILVQREKLNTGKIRTITVQHGGESADLSLLLSSGSCDVMGMGKESSQAPATVAPRVTGVPPSISLLLRACGSQCILLRPEHFPEHCAFFHHSIILWLWWWLWKIPPWCWCQGGKRSMSVSGCQSQMNCEST